jgi:hypothetical protein
VRIWDRASAARGSATHRHREARALERPALASAASEAQLEPGWIVRDIDSRKVEVRFEGARIH